LIILIWLRVTLGIYANGAVTGLTVTVA